MSLIKDQWGRTLTNHKHNKYNTDNESSWKLLLQYDFKETVKWPTFSLLICSNCLNMSALTGTYRRPNSVFNHFLIIITNTIIFKCYIGHFSAGLFKFFDHFWLKTFDYKYTCLMWLMLKIKLILFHVNELEMLSI